MKYREGTVIPVVDALVILANVEYRLVAVSSVDDAKVAIRFVVDARVEKRLVNDSPEVEEALKKLIIDAVKFVVLARVEKRFNVVSPADEDAVLKVRFVVEAKVENRFVVESPEVEEALTKFNNPNRLVTPVTPKVEDAFRLLENSPVEEKKFVPTVSPADVEALFKLV